MAEKVFEVDRLPIEDARFYDDPYAVYEDTFRESPVVCAKNGMWAVGGYASVRACQSDPQMSSDLKSWSGYSAFADAFWGGEDSPIAKIQGASLVFMDGERHARLRSLVSKAFNPSVVEGLRPEIKHKVEDLIAQRLHGKAFDVINDFALPLSTHVISELLGIPESDRIACRDRAVLVGRAFGPPPTETERPLVDAAILEASEYYARLLEKRRTSPQDDLFSILAAVEDDGDKLSAEEIVVTCNLLFGAGHETTAGLIGNAIYALSQNPDQFKLLKSGEAKIDDAVKEFLRYDTPFQLMRKVTVEAVEVAGQTIPADSVVLLFIGAGNRDQTKFEDPHELDLSRKGVSTLSFGFGPHFCLGNALARLEAQEAIGALVSAAQHIQIAEPGAVKLPPTVPVRGFDKLPISID